MKIKKSLFWFVKSFDFITDFAETACFANYNYKYFIMPVFTGIFLCLILFKTIIFFITSSYFNKADGFYYVFLPDMEEYYG